jgi:catechol 2,3-dioxygenase-like lactoylglutathione lyase family enzyme
MPLGHLGLNVSDLAAAKAYYDGLMPLLAFEPFIAADDQFSYRHRTGLQHLAFILKTPAEV